MLESTAGPRGSKHVRVNMAGLAVTKDVETSLLACVTEAAAGGSSIQACIKLSLALGIVEEALTRKKDAACPVLEHLQVTLCSWIAAQCLCRARLPSTNE